MPTQNEIRQPTPKLRLVKALISTIGSSRGQHAIEEGDRGDGADAGADRDRGVLQPFILRAFLQHIFQRAEKARHRDQAEPVEMIEQFEIRLVEIDQRQHADDDADAGDDVDEEQPVPRQRIGDVAADGRADGRRQRRDQADDRADDMEFASAETPCRRMRTPSGSCRRREIPGSRATGSSARSRRQIRTGSSTTVKPAAEIANNSRVPSARDRNPDSGIAITSAIR